MTDTDKREHDWRETDTLMGPITGCVRCGASPSRETEERGCG